LPKTNKYSIHNSEKQQRRFEVGEKTYVEEIQNVYSSQSTCVTGMMKLRTMPLAGFVASIGKAGMNIGKLLESLKERDNYEGQDLGR
jgi:hypothetical protein